MALPERVIKTIEISTFSGITGTAGGFVAMEAARADTYPVFVAITIISAITGGVSMAILALDDRIKKSREEK